MFPHTDCLMCEDVNNSFWMADDICLENDMTFDSKAKVKILKICLYGL